MILDHTFKRYPFIQRLLKLHFRLVACGRHIVCLMNRHAWYQNNTRDLHVLYAPKHNTMEDQSSGVKCKERSTRFSLRYEVEVIGQKSICLGRFRHGPLGPPVRHVAHK